MSVVPTSTSTFPCLFPAESAGAGKGRRWSPVRCWSHRHTTSIAQEGGPTTGSTWTRDGRRRQVGPIVGLPRHNTCTPGRSGVGSHRRRPHGCPHPVTCEPFSSWTTNTSRHGAFQEEVASSDLGETRRKGGNHPGSRREGKRGTPGPLLPPKANPGAS